MINLKTKKDKFKHLLKASRMLCDAFNNDLIKLNCDQISCIEKLKKINNCDKNYNELLNICTKFSDSTPCGKVYKTIQNLCTNYINDLTFYINHKCKTMDSNLYDMIQKEYESR